MHIPVLLKETIEALNLKKGGIYVDCTVNRAGHSQIIGKQIGERGTLIIIDLDSKALKEAAASLKKLKKGPKVIAVNDNFRNLSSILLNKKIKEVDGIIADLGISSEELDSSGRGFSIRFNEPLLMTFTDKITKDTLTAKDVVNDWKEESLASILYGFADERFSRRIAKAITHAREKKEITTTFELIEIIRSAVPASYQNKKIHFATKTFQAIRMAVNDELGAISELITSLPKILKKGGRAAIITFHSTEDRTVKNLIRNNEMLKLVSKKAIMPSREETRSNPRSRSAQLRIAERI